MRSTHGVKFRQATTDDVPLMVQCHLADPTGSVPDTRIAAYLDGQHHPQKALLERVGFVALAGSKVVGYLAGHLTTRHDCHGEIQYLFVAPEYRRQGIATTLVGLLADWFQEQDARKVCVGVANDSPPEAQPFFENIGASPLKKNWYAWKDIGVVQDAMR
jgi:ribosomal protein S18 acetylase RimI-like enzyme